MKTTATFEYADPRNHRHTTYTVELVGDQAEVMDDKKQEAWLDQRIIDSFIRMTKSFSERIRKVMEDGDTSEVNAIINSMHVVYASRLGIYQMKDILIE